MVTTAAAAPITGRGKPCRLNVENQCLDPLQRNGCNPFWLLTLGRIRGSNNPQIHSGGRTRCVGGVVATVLGRGHGRKKLSPVDSPPNGPRIRFAANHRRAPAASARSPGVRPAWPSLCPTDLLLPRWTEADRLQRNGFALCPSRLAYLLHRQIRSRQGRQGPPRLGAGSCGQAWPGCRIRPSAAAPIPRWSLPTTATAAGTLGRGRVHHDPAAAIGRARSTRSDGSPPNGSAQTDRSRPAAPDHPW